MYLSRPLTSSSIRYQFVDRASKCFNNFLIFKISLCSTIYCLRTGNRFSTIMAPYNYEPVSIIYGFSLPQFPEAFTQTHIYFMALHDIPKNVSTETPIYFARFPTLPKLYYSYFHSQPIVLIPKSLLPPVTTLTVAESPSPGLNCELPQNIITSACRYVEEIVNCRSGQLSAYEPSTNTVQGTSGCVIVSCRVARVTNSQPRQSCCQILYGEHFEVQLYCVGTFGSPQNFAPTLSLPTTHLRSTAGTSDKKCIVHISHVPLHCYQPNNSKFHPDSYFSSFS